MPSSSGGSDGSESTVVSRGERVLKKGPWTAAEDAILLEYVKKHGEGNWNAVQRNSGLSRCGKSCRLRWANHLRPNLKKGSFSPEEESLILELHAKLGNKWARMAAQMPGRTDNEIKNYWNTRIKRRQRAGLPLYPPHVQRSASYANPRGKTPHLGNDAQLAAAQSPKPPCLDRIPFNFLLMPPSNAAAFSTPQATLLAPEQHHRLKRLREESIVKFGSPFLARPLQVAPAPPALLPYSSGNYDLWSPLASQQPFSVKMELPSSQLFAAAEPVPDGGGEWGRGNNSGLLDALLEEAHPVSAGSGTQARRENAPPTEELLPRDTAMEKRNWLEENGGIRDGDASGALAARDLLQGTQALDASPAAWESESTEEKLKDEAIQVMGSAEDDLSALLDVIPVEPMPMPLPLNATISDWYSGDSGEMSSNVQSSSMTGEEIGLEMQQLVTTSLTIGDDDHKWTSGSSHWSNAPGIC